MFRDDKYVAYSLDSHIALFQQFYSQHQPLFIIKLNHLAKFLTSDDFAIVNRFIDIVLALPLPSKDYLIKKDRIYNAHELKRLKQEILFMQNQQYYYHKYRLQGFEKLEVNVFKYHLGLKNLDSYHLAKLKDQIFIDVGAFWGDSALILQQYQPRQIYAFEPNSVNYQLLLKTIANNKLTAKVIPQQTALGNTITKQDLFYISKHQNHGASLMFKPFKGYTEEVEVNTLDSICLNWSAIALLKLDTEGMNLAVLRGAQQLIAHHKPLISCAIYHNPQELFEIIPYLYSMNPNYVFKIQVLSYKSPLRELNLIAIDKSNLDHDN